MARTVYKTHARDLRGDALCGIAGTTIEPEYATCLRCLYWLGRYMPLRELYEHQKAQMRAANYGVLIE